MCHIGAWWAARRRNVPYVAVDTPPSQQAVNTLRAIDMQLTRLNGKLQSTSARMRVLALRKPPASWQHDPRLVKSFRVKCFLLWKGLEKQYKVVDAGSRTLLQHKQAIHQAIANQEILQVMKVATEQLEKLNADTTDAETVLERAAEARADAEDVSELLFDGGDADVEDDELWDAFCAITPEAKADTTPAPSPPPTVLHLPLAPVGDVEAKLAPVPAVVPAS